MTISGLLRCLLHTVFPTNCATCGDALWDDPIPFFCRRCWSQISPIPSPACPRCARPFASPHSLSHSPTHECGDCRRRPPFYNHARTPYAYQSPIKEAVALLKYKGKTQLAPLLAELMAETGPPVATIDAIVAVPLHPTRLRKREFNQSLLLALSLGKRWNIPVLTNVLLRTKLTPPQTSLSRRARLTNLRKCFAVKSPAAIEGKNILIVDDVVTTGTTVNECAKTLRKAGAQSVHVQTLARTVWGRMILTEGIL